MAKFWENLLKRMNLQSEKNCWRQDIEKKEFLIAMVKGIAILTGLTYLFYNRIIAGLILSPLLLLYLFFWEKEMLQKKEQTFQMQFKDAMQSLASSLETGYSMENAVREVKRDMEPLYGKNVRIQQEFAIMVHQLAMNFSLEYILGDFAKRVKQEDVDSFVTVYLVARKSGGDSIAIIRNAMKMICDKIEVKREIQVMTAAKRFEFHVMTIIPLGIIFYMRISFPEFMKVLYGNLAGVVVMTGCLIVYAVAYWLGRKVSTIEV